MRRFRNVKVLRQKELSAQFRWLNRVHEMKQPQGVQRLSISVFDHWLSQEEASRLLGEVSQAEQLQRDSKHAELITRLAAQAEMLHYVVRGRQYDRLRFRAFTSPEVSEGYFKPGSASNLRPQMLRTVFPEHGAVYYEGYDDTWHLFFTSRDRVEKIASAAKGVGLYVLEDG